MADIHQDASDAPGSPGDRATGDADAIRVSLAGSSQSDAVERATDDQGWTETDLRPYLDRLDQYVKELASLTATTSGEEETTSS